MAPHWLDSYPRFAPDRIAASCVRRTSSATARAIAETIGERLGVPTKSVPAEHFGWMAMAVSLDNRASNEATRERLGWMPERAGLLDDMRAHYFGSP